MRALRAAPGPLEDLGEADRKPMPFARRRDHVLEREPVEADGLVEGELGRGLLRGALGVAGRAMAVARGVQVHRERVGLVSVELLDRPREAAVVFARRVRREAAHDRLPEAIVAGLDELPPVAEARAHQAVGAQERITSSRPSTMPAALPATWTERGRAPTATSSIRLRAGEGSHRRRSSTICSSVNAPFV